MVINYKFDNKETKKGLYLVSTPIGNLGDITFRAVEILKKSDYILCEDTRVSKNLFNKYDINSKLISNHKFNETKNLKNIINLLKDGSVISLVSDAGTPSISDPGAILIRECLKNDIDVVPIPGPSAITTALSISGFSEKFFFYGFFPDKKKDFLQDLQILSDLNSSIVFFISSKKINKIIPDLKEKFVGRKILICREMTKFYEEFVRLEMDKLELFDKDLKGELTVIISEKGNNKKNPQILSESDKVNIKKMMKKLSIKEVVSFVSENRKVSKKLIYNFCLKIKNEK
jgi:16S rRNA (cytidine1402-2'-O)-methyltransferase